MKKLIGEYKIVVASDVIRDGLGVELWDNYENIIAEIFRCDIDQTIILRTFDHDVPLEVIEGLIEFARERLEPFENGARLPKLQPVEFYDQVD